MNINRKVARDRALPSWSLRRAAWASRTRSAADSEEQVTGPDADRAKSAALDAVGGGTVTRSSPGGGAAPASYEVEVQRRRRLAGRGPRRRPVPARSGRPADDDSGSPTTNGRTRTEGAETTTEAVALSRAAVSERQRDPQGGRGLARGRDHHAAAVRRRDRPHDRQPQPGAASGAAVVGAGEALERLGLEPVREAGPVVGDLEHDRAVVARGRTALTSPPPWRSALSTRLPSACSIRSGSSSAPSPLGRGDARSLARASRARSSNRVRTRSSSTAQLDRLAGDRQPALVRSRDHQQVLGELREPVDLLDGRAKRGAQLLGRAARAPRELELGPQGRQRGAQLVAGVGDEDALALQRGLDPVEHRVERLPEPVDLVLGARAAAGARRCARA